MILFNKATAVDGVLCPPLGHVLFHSLNNFFFFLIGAMNQTFCQLLRTARQIQFGEFSPAAKKTSDSEVSEKPDVVPFGRGACSEVE